MSKVTQKIPLLTAILAASLSTGTARAVNFDMGDHISARWGNTFKYSASWRLNDVDTDVAGATYDPATHSVNGNPNTDGGDYNFDTGLVSTRLDLLSEFDVVYKRKYGFRVSAAAWYDDVYNKDNDSPREVFIPNILGVPNGEFADSVEELHGKDVEILDAFFFARFRPGGRNLNIKVGQFAQLYGESVFFGANGVAAAQATPDIIKLLSVPNSQFKEILRPVEQASFTYSISPKVSIGAYYLMEWESARLPGSGSYFSFGDLAGSGANVVFFPNIFGNPATDQPLVLHREESLDGSDSGQWGAQLKFSHNEVEYGLYASRHHERTPQFYFHPVPDSVGPSSYKWVFPEDIEIYGFSASTLFGETNVAIELSYRDNQSLLAPGTASFDFHGDGDNDNNPLYPVGSTLHANLSAISLMGENALWDGASFIGEFAYHYVNNVDENEDNLDPNADDHASALRFIFQPEYFQVFPGVDLQVPFGVGVGVDGNTAVLTPGSMPAEGTGDISAGLKFDVRHIWQASLNYTHYFGSAGPVLDSHGANSYDQFHRDRDFISVSVQRAF